MSKGRQLDGKTVAILATDGFEHSELTSPRQRLRAEGATVEVVVPNKGEIRGWKNGDWSETIPVDRSLDQVSVADYDALVLPGGVINPDHLRRDEAAVDFVRDFFREGKPVAAICHGPWMLAEAGVANGRRMTSAPSIRTDLVNAGAQWVDQEVVVDQGLVTSRGPEDLSGFNDKLVEEIREGVHAGQTS